MRLAFLPLLLAAAAPLAAQGSISSQGFGYPAGGLSGGAAATAGASAESDANSTLNPAAIARTNRYSIMLRYEPEFRNTTLGDVRAGSRIARFPAFQATGAFGRWVGALSVSTMLDRTFENTQFDTLNVLGAPTPSRLQTFSDGAVSDARAAVSYILSPRLQLGVGLHGIVGELRTGFQRSFPGSTTISPITEARAYGYSGSAISLGVVAEPIEELLVSASLRSGGAMTMDLDGAQVAEATVPSRTGLGVAYFGISGLSMFARWEQTRWSDMDGLGTANVSTFDARELSAGVEALGPRLRGVNTLLRAGLRDRGLPFGVNGEQVNERGYAFGIGIPVARARAVIDIGAQRLERSVTGADESAWLLSLGFGIRP